MSDVARGRETLALREVLSGSHNRTLNSSPSVRTSVKAVESSNTDQLRGSRRE